ncbi:aminoglycoside phosphotransferase family protein [bacterium]|nr:aminoglycoside phosphotransferase family protein [bacterium]MCI0602887.1 aminoglycoside phosphotransferase family protein [bacterium]
MKIFNDAAGLNLSPALDVTPVLEELRLTLPDCKEGLEIVDARIQDVQYKPGITCRILYKLKLRHKKYGRTGHQYLSAQLLGSQENFPAAPEHLTGRYNPKETELIATPLIHLHNNKMVLYSFPIDPALPALMDVLDADLLREGLKRMWARRNVHVLNAVVDLLSYTPQARAAIITEVLCESRDRHEPELRRLVGKIHAYKKPSSIFAGSWALWRALNRRIKLAPPIGYVSSLNLTLQEQVRGQRLPDLAHKGTFVKPVRHAARAIAVVHSLDIPLNSVRTPEKEASVVHRWKPVLMAICPERSKDIERLCNQVAEDLNCRAKISGPVHGDFHPANVMWDGRDVTLIDLDEMSYGDPLLDIGRFLASLRVSALRVSSDHSALAGIQEAFLEEYFRKMSGDEKSVRLFEAASLLIAAASPFRLQRPGWKESTEMLIEEADRVWKISGRGSFSTVNSNIQMEVPQNQSAWMKDGVYMQSMLDEAVKNVYGAELTYCRIKDAEPPAVARYDLRGHQGAKKWGVSAEAVCRAGKGARTLVHFLSECRRIKETQPDSNLPILPLPICHLKSFSMIILEIPEGIPLSSMTSNSESFREEAARLGATLASLHELEIDLKTSLSIGDYLIGIQKRITKLQDLRPDLIQKINYLFDQLRKDIKRVERYSPVLLKLHPDEILIDASGIAFRRIERMTMAHPYLDLSELIGRMALIGIREDNASMIRTWIERLLEAYGISDSDRYDLAAFEIGALLRLASKQVEQHPDGLIVDSLIDSALVRLSSL